MASINFPSSPSVGDVYSDPVSGSTYVCTAVSPTQWTGSGSTTNIDGTYLRLDAANDPMIGDLETQGVTTDGQVVGTQQVVNIATSYELADWRSAEVPRRNRTCSDLLPGSGSFLRQVTH